MKTDTKLTLSNATAGHLQDAWHYATLIVNRRDSTFDGDRQYPAGVRGQMLAYEELLAKLDQMSADNETWELVKADLQHPETFADLEANTRYALNAIESVAASKFGIDAKTCEPLS